jgi:hypothetical protein
MATFIVDICKTVEYTDSNGITWWSNKYRGSPNVPALYKNLIGQEQNGINVVDVIQDGVWIKAIIETEMDVAGLYLSTQISGGLTEDKHIESMDYKSAKLMKIPISGNYSVEDAEPFKLYGVK